MNHRIISIPAHCGSLKRILAVSASALSIVGYGSALAQGAGKETTDEVVVTGTRLSGSALEAPQPVQQFTGEDIIRSGEPNLIDFLADVPALQGSFVPEDTTGAGLGDGGLSLLNLRQLGADRTLVLVDGRRHVGASPGTASVDVDTIPRLLIKRVDVVTGASSAVYGADAVSGVVNFILKDKFEGLEIDLAGASISQGFEGYNGRASLLAGKNFFDDRLNVYISAEYEESDEIQQSDLRIGLNDSLVFNVDVDPLGNPVDGVTDNILLAGGLTSISRPVGGIFTLAHDIRQNGIVDNVNIPFVTCSTASTTSGNCFIIDPGFSTMFGPGGTPVAPNFGSFRDPTGTLRTIVQNGSGDPLSSFQVSQLPKTDAIRLQGGTTFAITPRISAYAEAKYVKENSLDNFQPAFFDIQYAQTASAATALTAPDQSTLNFPFGGLASLNQFRLPIFTSNPNPLIPASVLAAINANTRTTFASNTCTPDPTTGLCTNPLFFTPTGSVAHQVGQIRIFTSDFGARPQDLSRDVVRVVGGLRGDFDKLAFVNNGKWDVGFTYGRVEDNNRESGTIDVVRLANSLDVIANTDPSLGALGAPICRIKVLAAAGLFGFDPNDPVVKDCVPGSAFGAGGLTPTAPYVLTSLSRTNKNAQYDLLGSLSGELFDLWGAGPIQFAIGGEWRREVTEGTVEFQDTDPRLLFANTGSDFARRSYEVKEGFFEGRIPLLKDAPFVKSLEAGGAVRVSDYTSIGRTTTWNVNGAWQLNDSIGFRGTYGVAVRAPNLDELFSPPSQTFIQINDPCSQPVILATSDPQIQANRVANCAALGIPATYVDPNPGTSNPGNNAGNPFLIQESSKSWTASLLFTPEFIPNFSAVIDFFNIRIEDAIAAAGIQTVVNLCVDGNVPNTPFCNTFTRDPSTFEIVDFIQGAVNFSALETQGVDFAARYNFDLADFSLTKKVPGNLSFNMRGTYLIRRNDFANIVDPTDATELDGNINFPRVRFLFTTSYSVGKLVLAHDFDFITSQEINERNAFVVNTDSGLQAFRTTGRFTQHDLTATYNINDNFSVRAGVVNLFDAEPGPQIGFNDLFDLFGRRYFIGARASF